MTNCFFTRHCVHFCTTCSFRICKIFLLSNFAGHFISSLEKVFFLVFESFEIQDAIICWISSYFFWLNYIFCRMNNFDLDTHWITKSLSTQCNVTKKIELILNFTQPFGSFGSSFAYCVLIVILNSMHYFPTASLPPQKFRLNFKFHATLHWLYRLFWM